MSTSHLGGWLKHEREARGLTVEAIASQTKIPSRHLEALERGDLLTLPAFYQRAEVRAVARAVGVDERLAVARLDELLTPAEPPLQPEPTKPAPRVRSEYMLLAIGTAVLVVALLGWGSFERTSALESTAGLPRAAAATPAVEERNEPASTQAVQPAIAAADEVPALPAGPTELVIRTQPEGARVTVNGIGWGVSPVTIRHLEPGEKRIRVSMDGYPSAERSVMVDEGARASVRISLF
jgi:cytoskeletal protein RodZ